MIAPESNSSTKRVLLIAMPWANPEYPSLALGLLSATLRRSGIECDALHANIWFLRHLGDWPLYRRMSYAAEGDVVFTPQYFGSSIDDAAALISERTGKNHYPPLVELGAARALIARAGEFIHELYARVDWSSYDIVGFSLMFQQLVASLALAQRIKREHPGITIVAGGPSCDDTMGLEMVRSFPEIDHVVIGEADETIVPLVRELRDPDRAALRCSGVVSRTDTGPMQLGGPSAMVRDLDALPIPDYRDYFSELEASGLERVIQPILYIEGSRGCWWGEKSVCTFCGLNGATIRFRAKSAERLVGEIRELSAKYAIHRFWTSDNILDHRAWKTLLPLLRQIRVDEGLDITFFFEIKSNLNKEQVRALRDAGITWVQPGIESFSDHVLELMHKGSTAIQQIQLLKFLAELEMDADWNILYQNPGERPEDYDEMTEILPFLHHLPPPAPGTVIPMNLQRFTRYHRDPTAYGIEAVRPGDFYARVFPRGDIDLERLVYYFDYEHPDKRDAVLAAARARFLAAVETWRRSYRPSSLSYIRGPGFVRIRDRRLETAGAEGEIVETLVGLQAEVYSYCDSARAEAQVLGKFETQSSRADLLRLLYALRDRRFLLRTRSGRWLALALRETRGREFQLTDVIAAFSRGHPAPPEPLTNPGDKSSRLRILQ